MTSVVPYSIPVHDTLLRAYKPNIYKSGREKNLLRNGLIKVATVRFFKVPQPEEWQNAKHTKGVRLLR